MFRAIILILFCIFANGLVIESPESLRNDVGSEITSYHFRYWGIQNYNLSNVRIIYSNVSLCNPTTNIYDGAIVIAPVDSCSDETKALHAQAANAIAFMAIVTQPGDGSYSAGIFDGNTPAGVIIPALLINLNVFSAQTLINALKNGENVTVSVTPEVNPYRYPGVLGFLYACQVVYSLIILYLLYLDLEGWYRAYLIESFRFTVKQAIFALNFFNLMLWLIQQIDPFQQNGLYNNAAIYFFYLANLPFQLVTLLLLTFYWLEVLNTMKYTVTLIKYRWAFYILSAIVFVITYFAAIGLGFYIEFASNLLSSVSIVLIMFQFAFGLGFIITGIRLSKTLFNATTKAAVNRFVIRCGAANVITTITYIIFYIATYSPLAFLVMGQYYSAQLAKFAATYYQLQAMRYKREKATENTETNNSSSKLQETNNVASKLQETA
jgi:hypothetical protein